MTAGKVGGDSVLSLGQAHEAGVPRPCPFLSLKHLTGMSSLQSTGRPYSQYLAVPASWAHPCSPLSVSAPGAAPNSQGPLGNNRDIESAPDSLSWVMILGSHSCSRGFKAPAQWSEEQKALLELGPVVEGAEKEMRATPSGSHTALTHLPVIPGPLQVQKD